MEIEAHNPASRSALAILEIIERVFSFNTPTDAARYARVCVAWRDPALDLVWYHLDRLPCLFQLLAPLEPSGGTQPMLGFLRFSKAVDPDNWERFLFYSSRVRILELNPEALRNKLALGTNIHLGLHDSVFSTIATTRPVLNLFPNLRELALANVRGEYASWLHHSVMFLHNGLRWLSVDTMVDRRATSLGLAVAFIKEMRARAPLLEDLTLWVAGSVPVYEKQIAPLLSGMRYLRALQLPSCTLTSSLLLSVSRLPNLKSITMDVETRREATSRENVHFLPPVALKEDCFPQLEILEIQGQLAELSRQFSHTNCFFVKLRRLSIDVLGDDDHEHLSECIEALVPSCPALSELSFTRREQWEIGTEDLEAVADSVTLEDLQPLSQIQKLESFTLFHTTPVWISNDELVQLVASCSSMSTLNLNCEPIGQSGTLLSIGVLATLAEQFPRLERLGLYLCDSVEDLPNVVQPFRNLYKLDLGTSKVDDEDIIVSYLGALLPMQCDLDVGETRIASAADALAELWEEDVGFRRASWESVRAKLPPIIQARVEKEERMALRAQNQSLLCRLKELEAENAALRAECL